MIKLKRRKDGTFKPRGKKAKRKPGTCRCSAYKFPHARGGGKCRK